MIVRSIVALTVALLPVIGISLATQAATETSDALKVHPGAGKFRLQHDPDKPLIAAYGGIGLWQNANGMWTGYGVTSPEQIDFLIKRCSENGLKRIYASLQEEQYPSEITPTLPEGQTDYVAMFIEKAHQNNIEVYADQPTFTYVLAKNGEFVKQHPHVFTNSYTGEPDTHMMSAAWPEVRKYKRDILMEWLKNYPIDGLQLDFIRFPYYTHDLREGSCKHGYDEPLLKAFRALYSYPDDYRPEPADPRWVRLRREAVSQFIRELNDDLKARGIEMPIGVYNSLKYGSADSSRTVLQDWAVWEQEGLVTEHSPMMIMSGGMTNLVLGTKSVLDKTRPGSEVLGPIFLAEGFETFEGDIPTPDMVRDAARRLIKAGCNKLWFCRPSEIEKYNLWPVVKEISEWSISEIRAENFDPAYENLMPGLNLKNWSSNSQLNITESDDALVVKRTLDRSATLSRSITFRVLTYEPVYSLTVGATLTSGDANEKSKAALAVTLNYTDGTTETIRKPLKIDLPEKAARNEHAFIAQTDFRTKVLKEARIDIDIPAGQGEVTISRFDLQRDLEIKRN